MSARAAFALLTAVACSSAPSPETSDGTDPRSPSRSATIGDEIDPAHARRHEAVEAAAPEAEVPLHAADEAAGPSTSASPSTETSADGEPAENPWGALDLASLRAPPPITLRHARELAASEAYEEAAAIYAALLASDPDDARLHAGRGFCAMHLSGGLGLARRDMERARILAGDDRRLQSLILHNLDELAEREAAACEVEITRLDAVLVSTMVEVIQRLVPAGWERRSLPTEERAATEYLCSAPCDPAHRFVANLVVGGMETGHLVTPGAGGVWVLAGVTAEAEVEARCGAPLENVAVVDEEGWVRITSEAEIQEMICVGASGEEDTEDCIDACESGRRHYVTTFATGDGTRGVRLRVSMPERGARRPSVTRDSTGITLQACDARGRVAL